MQVPSSMPHLKGFLFSHEIIAYAVWAYHRFALSATNVFDYIERYYNPRRWSWSI